MEETKKKAVWGMILCRLCIFVVVIGLWQVLILKLLEKGVINTFFAMFLISAGTLIVFAGIFLIIKSILDGIRQIAQGGLPGAGEDGVLAKANKLAERNDELGEMVKDIQKSFTSFSTVIGGIRNATKELGEVSDDFKKIFGSMTTALERTSEEVSNITNNAVSQADSTVDMKEKIDAIGKSIDHITEDIKSLAKSAENMKESNRLAESIMEELIAISKESGEAIEDVRKQTDLTNQSAQQIRTATEIIAGISSQTNLLALNASIEAARAGEHGKGFAVVAEEIRTLADQSRESTEQINNVVNDLIGNSNISVEITEKVSEAFDRQNEKIKDTEEIFRALNQEIGNTSGVVEAIDAEVVELDGHKNVIESGIASLTDLAEQNAKSAEVTTENMEEFRQIVDECRLSTDRVVSVSDELVGYIGEVNKKASLAR